MTKLKIEIERIKNEEARQVCFSKRRPNVFKKASELHTICGAEVAMVVKSPAGNFFSFGAPSVGSVLSRFHATTTRKHSTMGVRIQHDNSATTKLHELNQQYIELQNQLQAQNEKMKALQEVAKKESGGKVMGWLDSKVEELCQEDLEEFKMVLESLKYLTRGIINQHFQNYAMFSNMLRVQHSVTALPNQQFLLSSEDVKPIIHHVPSSTYGWNTRIDSKPNSSDAHVVGTRRYFPK
uniref:MADS-box domain-containing protein n=1 Tax=Oryza punctata TaxID=4537 RepID=A0A0E0LB91_ORYPU